MASPTINIPGAAHTQSQDDNVWANLPPLHTIKSEELIRYQIVDWDPNNPHHPRYLAGHILIKSLFRRDHYYWIACSNPLPKDDNKEPPPPIYVNSPSSSSVDSKATATAAAQLSASISIAITEVNLAKSDSEGHGQSTSTSSHTMDSFNITKRATNISSPSNYTRLDITPSKAPIASGSSLMLPNIHHSPSQPSQPSSSASAYSPSLTISQRKRVLKSKEQEGRNIRAEFGKATLKEDGKPAGVEKAASGFFNLGPMSWHFRNLDDHDVKSEDKGEK